MSSRFLTKLPLWRVPFLSKSCKNGTSFSGPPCQQFKRYLLTQTPTLPYVTAIEVRGTLAEIVSRPTIWGQERDTGELMSQLPGSQSELTPRSMLHSYREARIPLSSDTDLRLKYVNLQNTVRWGRVMEDLDTMAVYISYTHSREKDQSLEQKSPLVIVTAMVDSIHMKAGAIDPETDIILRGHVTWVGSSSIEVSMSVEQELGGVMTKVIDANFLMVARDPKNKAKAFVNPLSLETEEEKMLFQAGEERKNQRSQEAKLSLLKTPPSEQERLVVHDLFLKTLDDKAGTFKRPIKPAGSVWMEDGKLKNIKICFPEQRNLYNKIFGGYLMRQAFELAWANALVYCKSRPYVIAVDDIIFRSPVEVGSLLYLSSQVVYTSGPDLQLRVHAEVVNPMTGDRHTTNVFHYTLTTKLEAVPPIIPKSYSEYMMYLDGKRHYEAGCVKQT